MHVKGDEYARSIYDRSGSSGAAAMDIFVFLFQKNGSPASVFYTHLDVYKRQHTGFCHWYTQLYAC